jgi:hypothetical protein
LKKIVKFIFIVSLIFTGLIGCNKEINLEPIAESNLAEYLKGKDPVLDNDNFSGFYSIVSRTCDKKTDDLIVSYNGNSELFDYQAKYHVYSTATKNGWVIDKFDIVESNYNMRDISPSMFKDLLEGVDKNVTMSGIYSLVSKELQDNVIKFVVRFYSDNGKYNAEYEGEAVIKDGKLELQKIVINTISDDDSEGGSSDDATITLSNNYDPNKKAADYGYKAPAKQKFNDTEREVAYFIEDIKPGVVVTNVEMIDASKFNVTYEKRYKYVKDVYYHYFRLHWDGGAYSVIDSKLIKTTTNSNFEGVYVNKTNGSYIIMHENWKIELHEFYVVDGQLKEIVLNEYHSISNTNMTWKNRKKIFKSAWTDGAEPESFSVIILSINEMKLNSNILSSKSGDKFVKVP